MDIPDHFFDPFVEDLSDPKCVQEIYNFSLSQIRGFVNYNDEEDLIQEVFYRLTKWPMGARVNSKRHYFSLLKVTIRQCLAAYWRRNYSQRNDIARRRFISELERDEAVTFELEGTADNVLQRLQIKETVQRLLDSMDDLEPRYQTLFRLRFVEERSHEEIAELLGISIRTSYRHEAQLRERLLKWLGDDWA